MKNKNKKNTAKKSLSVKKKHISKIDILQSSEDLLSALRDKEIEVLRTEDALVESMKRFRDLFEQSPIGVSIHDIKGNILIVNKAFQTTLGLKSFDDISLYNMFTDKRLSSVNMGLLKTGNVLHLEIDFDFDKVSFVSKREGTGYFLVTVSPIFREESVIGYMLVLQDITERKKIEEAQKLAQLGRLLSDMAHEVNNPLMIISGRAELALLKGVKDKKLKETLKIILDQCFFAKDIIQRLLKYSRLGKVKKESVDIIKTFDMILKLLSHHLKLSNIKVKMDIKGKIPEILGNEKQLHEVFMNILRNSSDAMLNSGKIYVTISKTKQYVKIEIKDTGNGMSKKVLDRIFEPFFTTKRNGTGLGLPVCHTIIQEHEGELKFESKVGKGTTAIIRLPYVVAKKK